MAAVIVEGWGWEGGGGAGWKRGLGMQVWMGALAQIVHRLICIRRQPPPLATTPCPPPFYGAHVKGRGEFPRSPGTDPWQFFIFIYFSAHFCHWRLKDLFETKHL